MTMGVSPRGPDETLVGRWYVVVLPRSVVEDSAVRNLWIAQLNLITTANDVLKNSEFVWGSGSFIAGKH